MRGVEGMKHHSLFVLIDHFLLAWVSAWRFLVAIACVVLCLYWGCFILFHLEWERIRLSRPHSILSGRQAINMGRGPKTKDWERNERNTFVE